MNNEISVLFKFKKGNEVNINRTKRLEIKMRKINRRFKSIRTKTVTILIVMFLVLTLIIYFILNSIMLDRIAILERNYVTEDVKRAENLINSEQRRLNQVAFDWGVWDDTYKYIKDKNKMYVINNLGKTTFLNLNLNVMAFIDKSGEFVYINSGDPIIDKMVPISKSFLDYISKSPISRNTNPNFRQSGIIMLPEGPMLIATSPILTSFKMGPVRGNLVVGCYLDNVKVEQLAKELDLNIFIGALSKSELTDLSYNKKPVEVNALNKNKIIGSTLLKDIYGNPALRLNVEMNRDISIIGRNGVRIVIVLLMVVSLIFTFLIMIFLERNILSRLVLLSDEVKVIGKKRLFYKRLKPQRMHDELSIVSDEINNMLDELIESQSQVVESERALKRANESLKTEIIEREITQKKIKELAYHDSLTGLPNRLFFSDKLSDAILAAKRSRKMFAVMFLDIDGFKMVNDTMGHDIGDQLLKDLAERLMHALEKSYIIARNGGDEILILIDNIKDTNTISLIADKVFKIFNEPFMLNNQECFLTTSIGVALYPADGTNAEILIKNADIAMYKAKERGKNQCVFFTPIMRNSISETMKLTNKLYRAMEKSELELYYQPQISCITKQIVGVEALLRWNSPEFGFVSPDKFITIAEQTGLIIPIGEWVLRTACKQNKLWQEAGYKKIRMGVNLSIKQFQSINLVKKVKKVLRETELDPDYLEIEITESIAMDRKSNIIETLNTFKNMGISIAIDDFGTEYSSLSYMKYLPMNRIKVAKQFVQGIGINDKDESITQAILVMAKSMGLDVIAEGVETEDELNFLIQNKCDEIQGYYYYKPMPAAQVSELIKIQK